MMKINIDKETYIEIKPFNDKYCKLKLKYKKDENTNGYIELKLDKNNLDSIVTICMSLRNDLHQKQL